MSRIDEALARARAGQPQEVAGIAGALDAVQAEFPVEEPRAQEPLAPVKAHDAIGQFPAEATEVRAEEHLTPEVPLGPDGAYARLPGAEKLMSGPADPASVEQYRRLAARLHLAQAERGTRVVVVTSALVGEGKTLTATNLAMTLSESYKRRVLLIDADLRRPWVHELFQVPNLSGLNDGLRASTERKVPVIRFSEYLSVLTAGRPDSDPMGVLTSERMRRILDDAAAAFDWVIVDTPPVALLTDAHLLASIVDAVLLVVRAGKTPLHAIRKAAESVGREKVLGVVLNCAEPGTGLSDYQYYGYVQKGAEAMARVGQ